MRKITLSGKELLAKLAPVVPVAKLNSKLV
jgi:hypothetical protein